MKSDWKDPRWALQVLRYHTWPHVRAQSVGEHSAQVARILLAIWPEAPRHVLVHCIVHDVGEVQAGDPPYPSKRMNPDLARGHARVERDAHLAMCIPWSLPAPQNLTDFEKWAFKLAEFIEMWEWGLHEGNLGNRYADLVALRCMEAIEGMRDNAWSEAEELHARGIRGGLSQYIARRRAYEEEHHAT